MGGGQPRRNHSSRSGRPRMDGQHAAVHAARGQRRARPQGERTGGPRPGAGHGRRKNRPQEIHYSNFVRQAEPTATADAFVPTYAFSELPISVELKTAIAARGYATPTPIQDATIPITLRGRDVVGIANTGTGKTGAFLIPLIEKVRSRRGEQVLIVTPTRELALQIDEELRALTRGMRVFSTTCVGGVNINPQLRALRQRNEFIIGTPGRLKDLIGRGALDLSRFNAVVLDEADRMLDMGFINDMRFLMSRMPTTRQTLFFSATFSPDVKAVVGEFLTDPAHVSVKTRDTSENVDQDVVHIRADERKVDVLERLLRTPGFEKVLVFGRTKYGVEKLSTMLVRRGVSAVSIHGNKDHNKRMRALAAFKNNEVRVLVATDVAARGLDIPNVSHVINYDVPTTFDDYVHRIGRTGRAERTGRALTFIGEGARGTA